MKKGSSSRCLSVITDLFLRAECYIIDVSAIQEPVPENCVRERLHLVHICLLELIYLEVAVKYTTQLTFSGPVMPSVENG